MTDAELAALRRIVDGLKNIAYAEVAKRPEDIYRAWYVTRFERDTVARILGDPPADRMAYLKAMKGSG
jgi:hypothetical protein